MATVVCTNCGRKTELHGGSHTSCLVCSSCAKCMDVEEGVARLSRTDPKGKVPMPRPLLPFGAKGSLRGSEFTVLGVIERADGSYTWQEYCLIDGDGRTRWLWVDRGHFSLSRADARVEIRSGSDGYRVAVDGCEFERYNAGQAKVCGMAGEFTEHITLGARSAVEDYVCPPMVASREQGAWTVFDYVDRDEIARAYRVDLPPAVGVGLNQPSPYAAQRQPMAWLVGIAIVALFFVQWLTGPTEPDHPLLSASLELGKPRDVELGEFTLYDPWSALRIQVRSGVTNAWADVELSLINQATGREYSTVQGVEYYHGSDSEGAWTEGSGARETYLRAIPRGRYRVFAKGTSAGWAGGQAAQSAFVSLSSDGPPPSNAAIAFFAILLIPAVFLWRSRAFEVRRWQYSDFSPYEDDEE